MSIKEKLKYGDVETIAAVSGVSKSYVYKVLSGIKKSKKVEMAAQRVISTRESLIRESGAHKRRKSTIA